MVFALIISSTCHPIHLQLTISFKILPFTHSPLHGIIIASLQPFDGCTLLTLYYNLIFQLRPYTQESTGSRPISEVKLVMAKSVLRWVTTREYFVLQFYHFLNEDVVRQEHVVTITWEMIFN